MLCISIMVATLRTNAATYAHYCEQPFAMVMCVGRMVRWTTKHGLDVCSAGAFALFGLVKIMLFSAYMEGREFADIALNLLDVIEDKSPESRVTYLVYFMVTTRSRPIHSTLKHFLVGYKKGMEGKFGMPITSLFCRVHVFVI